MSYRLAASLAQLRGQANMTWPLRSKASDGWIGDAAHAASVSDHNPDRYGVVRAFDLTHDPAHGVVIADIAEQLRASRDPRIKYVIANGRIFAGANGPSPWVWRGYTGSNKHTSHMHVSVVSDTRAELTRPWHLVTTAPREDVLDMDETKLRAIIADEVNKAFRADVIPAPMFAPGNPTMTRDSAIRYAAEWALQARNRTGQQLDVHELATQLVEQLPDTLSAPVTAEQFETALRNVLGSVDEVAP